MAPTLHDISPTMTPEQRRADKRPTLHPVFEVRNRLRTHARITFAESPELYLREEMS